VIDIIKKQRQQLDDITIEVSGEREPNKVPSLFEKVHIHYTLYGELDADKAARAIDLSIEKYCSVVKIMEKTAKVTYSFDIKPFTGEPTA
jgi:putative redox protein